MKYFSMFSGIGGFERGIDLASGDLAKCVGYSEIDKYASSIYQYHYPKHKNYGDATTINVSGLPAFDLLVGGFPCQAFSIAGKRGGFSDTRGTLFFDVARVLKAKRPQWFLLENVKGLCSHDGGKTLTTIYGVLADLGYAVGWEVVNSCHFGVPQNRERIFIVGHLAESGGRVGEVLPVGEGQKENHAENLQQSNNDIAGTLNTKNNSGQLSVDKGTVLISDSGQGRKLQERNNTTPPLRASTAPGHHNWLVEGINQLNNPKHSNDRVYGDDGIGPTLNTMQGGNRQPFVNISTKIRRLTPIECERLQGFPDNWTRYGIIDNKKVEISDTQRYKCLGNAVTVNVIEAFMKKILPLINH